MSSVPLRARSPFFSFDAETGSRRPRWYTFLAGLLVVLLAAAGIVAGVGAANAHTPRVDADCYELTVDLKQYNGTNTVYVEINGKVEVDTTFGNSFSKKYTFDDPTVVNTWTVVVVAHDDKNFKHGWSVKRENKKTTPCSAPDLTLDGTVCNTVNGTTDLTATFSNLASGQTYTGELFRNGQLVDTFPATSAGKTWPGTVAGATYRLTITSDQHPGITRSIETSIVGCPQDSRLEVTAQQCDVTSGSNAGVAFTASSVVPGRAYVATVYRNGTPYNGGSFSQSFTPGASETSVSYTITGLPENLTGLTVVLTDLGSGAAITSSSFATAPCPDVPNKPVVSASECTVVGGDLEITVELSGLVPTRTYEVWVGATKVEEFVAAASTETPRVYPVAPGTFVVTIVDKLVPAASASSDSVTVAECPTQPDVALDAVECSVPGGSGQLTATFSGLGVGREYIVSITEGAGSAVPGYETPLTVTSASPAQVYSDLTPGRTYTVTIVDKLATNVKDAASRYLDVCPLTPAITLELQCLFLEGESRIQATIVDLEPGDEYRVDLIATTPPPAALPTAGSFAGGAVSAGSSSALAPRAVAIIDSQTITAGVDPSTVTFQVPNNVTYIVTVTHVVNSAVTNSASIFAAICDLPTFPLPPELPTLALTGAGDTTMPMLGALGLVQFGVALLALAAMLQFSPKRRRLA